MILKSKCPKATPTRQREREQDGLRKGAERTGEKPQDEAERPEGAQCDNIATIRKRERFLVILANTPDRNWNVHITG